MPDFVLRRADENDCEDLWIWRNDPYTRSMFFSQELVSWEDHVQWFQRSLSNISRFIFIGVQNGRKIGMVRFDVDGDGAFISINMNPDFRGKKLSRVLLANAESQLPSNISVLYADIKKENAASIRAFESAGYSLKEEKDKSIIFEKYTRIANG